jgi:hypothetical protein
MEAGLAPKRLQYFAAGAGLFGEMWSYLDFEEVSGGDVEVGA